VLYGRPGCHLCDDMLAVLEDLRGEQDFSIEERDVDRDAGSRVLYGDRVPVLLFGDEEICHYFIDLAKVREVFGRFR